MPRPNIQKDHLGPEHPHHDHHDHHVHHLHHEPVDHLSHLMARHHASLLERLSEQDEILRDILSRTHHRTSWGGGADEKPRPPRRKSYRSPIKVVEAQTDGKFVSETAHSAHSHIIKSYTAEDAERRDVSSSIHGHTMRRMLGQAATKFSHLAAPARHTKDTCTSCIRKIVESSAFEGFFALVVISNAIFIGVDVQYVIENPGPKPASYRVAQYSYTALFVIELAFRMLAAGRSFCRGDDWMWKVLDVFVVLTSLWEVLVDILQAIYEEQNGLSAIQGLQSVKSFRIIRLTRLVRTMQFIRVFQFVMALRMLVDSIISTLRSLFWALMLLTLVVYVFAVLFATAVNDYKREGTELLLSDQDLAASRRFWDSLPDSMLTLFMCITGGVNWEDVIRPLRTINVMWTYCFLFFIAFTYFAVLNVLTAVFCQTAIESAQNDQTTMVHTMISNKNAILAKLQSLFYEIGSDGCDRGQLTLGAFETKMKNPEVHDFLESLGLNVWDAWSFFKLLDADGGGAVDIEEFFQGCLRHRGAARSMDVGKIIQDQEWIIHNQGKFQVLVQDDLAFVKEKLLTLAELLRSESSESDENEPGINEK